MISRIISAAAAFTAKETEHKTLAQIDTETDAKAAGGRKATVEAQ